MSPVRPGVRKTKPIAAHVAERVRVVLRKERRWSMRELAEETTGLGAPLSRTVIATLDMGRREDISVDELYSLAAAFNVGLDQLLPTPPGIQSTLDPRAMAKTLRALADELEES